MQNQNKISMQSPINVASKLLFAVVALVAFQFYATAQTRFTRTTFNSAYTPISVGGGATSATATGDNANQTGIPIGFSFGYADSTFTTIGLSTNGLIWFDAIAPAVATGNTNMVTTGTPNQSLAPWFNNLIDDASSDILYQTQGAPGSRTFTVQYTNYPTFTGTPGSNVRMNCQVILYETTNVIEFRYGTLNVIGSQTTSGGAFIGMEWGTGGSGNFIDAVTGSSILSNRMLSPIADWPSYNFRFTPGIPATIAAGTYNVGVGQTYNSLTQAVADVNHRGITGAVSLNLTDAQYDTTAANGSNIFPIFVATPNADSINRLTISKSGAAATLAYRGSNVSASGAGYGTGVDPTALGHTSVPLMGVCASYTTISNINLITHGAGIHQVEIGLAQFELTSTKGAQYNFYDKISIDLDRDQGGVYGISSFSTSSAGGFAGTNSYNTWRDITIKDCNVGISLAAPNNATGPADQGNQITTSSCNTFNIIGDPNVPDDIIGSGSPYGVAVNGQNRVTVRNCIIQNITATSIYSASGIIVTNSIDSIEISNNIIRTIRRSGATLASNHWITGIRVSWPNSFINLKIFNNSISNLLSSYTGAPTATWAVVGIFIESNTGIATTEMYNNSVSINGSTFPNASSGCLSMNSVGEACQIQNNVFANFTGPQSGIAHHTCIYTNAASQYGNAGSLSNNNNFYIADTTNGYIARATSTYFKTLTQWQAAMTVNPGTDANSQVANPNFVNNATDLHPTPASTSLDGTGTTPPANITTDLDCKTRTAPYDIGAYWAGCWAEGGTVSPNAAIVCAQQTYVMSATGAASYPGIAYQWQRATVSGGPYSNVTGGIGTTTATYTTGKLNTGTYYYVLKVTCPGGLIDYSNELTITVNGLPNATITSASDTIFCSGGSVQLNAATAANRSYQWKKGANDIAGATTASYTATTTGTYKVVVTNTISGCSKSSNGIKVTSNPLPAATITPSGPLSFCAGDSVVLQANSGIGLTYKWKKGANYISGATLQNYTAKTAGTYKVEVTNSNGCKKVSAGSIVSITCKEDAEGLNTNGLSLNVHPNPASESISIDLNSDKDFEIEIVNAIGETFIKTKNKYVLDISELSGGVYFIKVFTNDKLFTEKFVKE